MNDKNGQYRLFWPELICGTLIRRYKRFLAEVKLADGSTVTAHCANSGAMTECCEPGRPVYLSFHNNPGRKLKYTWELIHMPASLVGVNTQIPNRLVAESAKAGSIPELSAYDTVRREVKTGNSRLDILLTRADRRKCFAEVKNCTLVKDRIAEFPDAVTLRGRKHLAEMEELTASGNRCVMFFLIQRMDADSFRPADKIDPAYGKALRQAYEKGVEILAYDVYADLRTIRINRRIPCFL
ncbi:MAG: DNA/RNA nuclease SfsA [Desulfococcaceae bacterium]